ncbi:hypothetical protein FOA52_015630 [Chlamydomonas sp. UWO 241]|nr:hypothetical protein FOA52_015630 [Chlamydomonas sp. UWO 241]
MSPLPKLLAFDLDATLWTPEMYELHGGAPFRRDGSGRVYDSAGAQVKLMGATAEVLRELATDPKWQATQACFAADRGQMITIVSAYSPTEAASDEEAGDFYLRVAALADKANDKRDLLIVAGGSQRRAWDSSQLRRPAVRREFNLQLSDRFGLLEAVPPEGADAQAEYDAMAAAIREVATNHLAPRGSRRRRGWQFTLSQRTLRLMDARQRAHTAWLRSKSAAAKRERNRANRAADAAVQRDRERWIGQQVAEAQDMLRKKNLRQFARACDRLAGRSRSHQIPPAMRDVSGALHSGPDGVLKAMTESFDKLYGGETKLSDETLNQLENDVAAFELTRATEVDEAHGRPPDLAETEACVAYVSRTEYPEWAIPCLKSFAVADGVTMFDVAEHKEIYPGSKRNHFRKIKDASGLEYDEMLFFDNERWNITDCSPLGITCVCTPQGLTRKAWTEGLAAYEAALARKS